MSPEINMLLRVFCLPVMFKYVAPGPHKALKNWPANKNHKACFAKTYPSPKRLSAGPEKINKINSTGRLIIKIILAESLIMSNQASKVTEKMLIFQHQTPAS